MQDLVAEKAVAWNAQPVMPARDCPLFILLSGKCQNEERMGRCATLEPSHGAFLCGALQCPCGYLYGTTCTGRVWQVPEMGSAIVLSVFSVIS